MTSQFNIDAIPLDAYLQLIQNIDDPTLADRITELNFGWYYDYDDTIYDDRIEAMKKLVVGAQPLFTQHRRLYHIYQQLTPGEKKANVVKFSAWYNPESSMLAFYDNLKILHVDDQIYRQASNPFGGDFLSPVPFLDRFMVPNLGGHGVAILNKARESAERIIRDGMPILHKHYEKTSIRFDLRHPIAIGSPGITDSILRNSWAAFSSIDLSLGTARKAIYDLIRTIEPTTWSTGTPIRAHFDKWMSVTATAVFWHEGVIHALTPRGLPSILVRPSHDTLPVTTQIHHTAGLDDVWQSISLLSPADVFDGRITEKTINPRILDLGYLICMAASILSMNLKVGQGQHRIQWTHSFLNAAHVGEAMLLAPMILHNANEAVK